MHKNRMTTLSLGLRFDDKSSFNLNVLNKEKANWSMYWGYRSVFLLPVQKNVEPGRQM